MKQKVKKVKKPRVIGKKVEFEGIPFDSMTERDFYIHLKNDENVKHIELQPQYTIIEPYEVWCKRCEGAGSSLNASTGNMNKCRLCDGKGSRRKRGAVYTSDFKVTYQDGYTEVIDVKGQKPGQDFSLRRRLFESLTGEELIVVQYIKKQWVRS